ncbi:Phenyloxazoline synthase MbtB [Corynebacterium lowii]|uniref:Phenyloxazoline synthase MbtB n=1 Tax=Corynebacterium lowii TaxID=1544413 RepID=A0A0Q0U7N1_9CORY|nr:Phenyloxazoline synthase MbtB [Corynebacterium lowii]
MLAAFARALAAETRSDSLTINVTRFDRDLTAPGISEVAGDFTALSLVSLRGLRSGALAGTAAEAQAELARAGEPERDTLRVAARAVRATGDPAAGLFPVVFTCGLGLSGGPNRNRAFAEQSFGTRVAAGSTTPQVVLDLQVADDRDGLHLTADYLTQILPEARVRRIVDRAVEALLGGTESPGGPGETPDPIAEAWASALGIPASSLTEESNFFREGGDSLRATEVVRRLRDRGMRVSLRSLLARPTLGDFRSELTRSELTPEGPGHKDDGDEWFDLTDVQASYLLGRTSAYRDGGIACQGYAEFAVDASLLASARGEDPERYPARKFVAAVTEAWDRVVALHPMLRAVIDREGRQRIDRRAEVPLRVVEVPGEAGAAEAVRADVRRELCEKNYPIGQAPMLDAVLTLGHGDPVFHLSVDLIITDYVGIRTVVADLDRCLAEPGSTPPAPEASFRDWIEERARHRRTPEGCAAIERDRAWWKDRLGDLPPALVFSPDAAGAEPTGDAGTTRRSLALDEAEWRRFREAAAEAGVTPSALVLGMFMAVARRYADLDLAEQDRALVTVTTVDRAAGSGDLSRVVGDFTSTVLVDAPLGTNPRKNALGVQGCLMDALEHPEYPGVRVLRDLRAAGGERRGSVPVVFTSTVGVRAEEEPRVLRLVPGSAISKTPQVLLDVQLSPVGEGVTVDWDSRDGGFHPDVLDQAFEDFRIAVKETAAAGEAVALPPRTPAPAGRALTLAEASGDPADGFLHGPFLRRVLEDPDAPAVLHEGRSVSRGELYAEAVRVARTLPEGEGPVVVAEEPGVAQIASQLAALLMGRPFVPVDPHWPEARRRGVVDVLRRAAGEASGASAHVRGEPVELPTADAAPEAPAWEGAGAAAGVRPGRGGGGSALGREGGDAGRSGLRHLHLRLDGHAEGRRGDALPGASDPGRHARTLGPRPSRPRPGGLSPLV